MKRTDITTETEIKLDECVVCASCTGLFAPPNKKIHVRERGQDQEEEYYYQSECPHCNTKRPVIMPLAWDAEDSAGAEVTDAYPGRA